MDTCEKNLSLSKCYNVSCFISVLMWRMAPVLGVQTLKVRAHPLVVLSYRTFHKDESHFFIDQTAIMICHQSLYLDILPCKVKCKCHILLSVQIIVIMPCFQISCLSILYMIIIYFYGHIISSSPMSFLS
jgi:hypothetical protein